MTKTEIKVLHNVVKTGFTFLGDSIFTSHRQAVRALNSLCHGGYLTAHYDEAGRGEYKPTDAARDFVQHGIIA